MADIRIKDLTTTASSTASDDFIAVDGATNGTRKLNAYSPSFGGNATVAGTLTVNGAGTSSFQSTTPSTVEIANTTSGLSASQFAANGVVLGTLKFGHPSDAEAAKFPSIVGQFNATDASFARKTWLNFYTSDASGNNLVASLTDNKNLLIGGTTDISGTSGLKVFGTTASTSTSTGALVVSGGVGVAKRIHSGEGLTVSADSDTQVTFVRNGTVSIGPDNTATPALVVSSAIKTAAPSGGTAANWKLGTVATVSPTSPNRTIEVDIGGTIYYIHAKTTNN